MFHLHYLNLRGKEQLLFVDYKCRSDVSTNDNYPWEVIVSSGSHTLTIQCNTFAQAQEATESDAVADWFYNLRGS